MKANVFRSANPSGIEDVPRRDPGTGEAVSLTTFCGTDLHSLRGAIQVAMRPS